MLQIPNLNNTEATIQKFPIKLDKISNIKDIKIAIILSEGTCTFTELTLSAEMKSTF